MFLPMLSSSSDGMFTSVSVSSKGTGTHALLFDEFFTLRLSSTLNFIGTSLPLIKNEFGIFLSTLYSNISEIDNLLCKALSGPSV
jgi:hypothetical protein